MRLLKVGLALAALFGTSVLRCEEPFAEEVRHFLAVLTTDKLPGMAVLVARDGKIVFQETYGFAALEPPAAVTLETKFAVGSVTKQFVAAAILRLAESGKLALTDTLEKFFPGFPRGREITLHQLLSHTSGLDNYTTKPELRARGLHPVSPAEVIACFRHDPLVAPPGTEFRYSNSGYFLLGEIVAQVSGKSLDAFLRETFFDPLGLRNSGMLVSAALPAGLARGYQGAYWLPRIFDRKKTPAPDYDWSWVGAAGGLFSTVGDLFAWTEALFAGKVVKADSLAVMSTPVTLPAGAKPAAYGYGLSTEARRGVRALGHNGGFPGWTSEVLRLPDQRCTIVVLANAKPTVAGRAVESVVSKIVAKLTESNPPPR